MNAILKELALAVVLAVVVYAAFDAGLGVYLERRELAHKVAMLEHQTEQLRGMVEDTRLLYGNMERPVAVVESVYSAREMVDLMAEQFRAAGVLVAVH